MSRKQEEEEERQDTNLPRFTDQCAQPKWDMIDTSGGPESCWRYQGAKSPYTGYAQVRLDAETDKKGTTLHRAIWAGFHDIDLDELPRIIEIHHECPHKDCVNPTHVTPLYTGEHAKLHRRRLSDEDVETLRVLHETSDATALDLANEFGIPHRTVVSAINGTTHYDLDDAKPEGPWFDVFEPEGPDLDFED